MGVAPELALVVAVVSSALGSRTGEAGAQAAPRDHPVYRCSPDSAELPMMGGRWQPPTQVGLLPYGGTAGWCLSDPQSLIR